MNQESGVNGERELEMRKFEPVTNPGRFESADGTDEAQVLPSEPVKPKIGVEEIRAARAVLEKYKSDSALMRTNIAENQSWWRLRDWTIIKKGENEKYKPHPTGGQLFSAVINKHADAMDNYPQPDVLPTVQDDEEAAKTLSSVIPCILEKCGYRRTYSAVWYDKLVAGTGITGVFWNPHKDNVGDVEISLIDPLEFYSDPDVSDIQDSRNVFTVERHLLEELYEEYPQLKDKVRGDSFTPISYFESESREDNDPDTANVICWYYKRGGLLHMCKFVGDEVLFADENVPEKYPNGFYAHGMYPFVVDVMYPVKNCPFGTGTVDAGKETQKNIDKLDQAILKTANANARQRYFAKNNGAINKDQFSNPENEIIDCVGSVGEDSIRPVQKSELNPTYLAVKEKLENELREATSNREFSNGGAAAGVTSGSAIAALQEAGNKTSRDMIRQSYFAFEQICYLVIELIREFYSAERSFRITGEGSAAPEYASISGAMIGPKPQNEVGVDLGDRVPVFDIRVVAQKSSAFSREIQNQRAQELYGLGFFAPDNADTALAALAMMDFEGKDKLEGLIRKNGTMAEQLQMLMQQMAQLQVQLGGGMMPAGGVPGTGGAPVPASAVPEKDPADEDVVSKTNTAAADAMRARVQNGASPI